MTYSTNMVGTLSFDNYNLDVYSSLNDPLFKLSDIGDMVGFNEKSSWNMNLGFLCEEYEKLMLPMVEAGQIKSVCFVTEAGLYNILSQSREPLARKWRKVVHEELIKTRKKKGWEIIRRFEEWDREADTLFFDKATGKLMKSVTVQGGDVEQVPYEM